MRMEGPKKLGIVRNEIKMPSHEEDADAPDAEAAEVSDGGIKIIVDSD